jgi:hypothetical protein
MHWSSEYILKNLKQFTLYTLLLLIYYIGGVFSLILWWHSHFSHRVDDSVPVTEGTIQIVAEWIKRLAPTYYFFIKFLKQYLIIKFQYIKGNGY